MMWYYELSIRCLESHSGIVGNRCSVFNLKKSFCVAAIIQE